MDLKLITAIIGSSVLASFITAFFTKSSKDKTDKLQYITNEREKWRDDLREAIVEVRKLFEYIKNNSCHNRNDLKFKSYSEAKTYFQVRLNPNDAEDNKILENFDDLDEKELKIIEESIAQLLKHDWERAKKETQGESVFVKIILTWIILFAIYYFYPIKEWLGITQTLKSNIFSFNTVVIEIFSFKTFLMIILIPIIIKILTCLYSLRLKALLISSRNTTTKTAICCLLNIPYRELLKERSVLNELLKRGYEVYRANSRIQKGWDLVVILENNIVKRIQIKTTILQINSTNNAVSLKKNCDYLIIVVIDENNEFHYYILSKSEVEKLRQTNKKLSISEKDKQSKSYKVKDAFEEYKNKWNKIKETKNGKNN